MNKTKKTKTYSDEVELKLDGFDINNLMNLLEEEIREGKNISEIKVAVKLHDKLKDVLDKNWGNSYE